MFARHTKLLSTMLLYGSMILTATSASAADASATVRSRAVSYVGSNLANDREVVQLYQRIRRAARHVCDRGQRLTLEDAMQDRACRAEAIASAVARIKNARLAAHHRETVQSSQG